MRRLTSFRCGGETLFATLDEAPGSTGLLIVSGGNEIRIGAHRGMAELAARIAEAGHPAFRYDRRGIGDSSGENNGFETTAEDISQAAAAFRRAAPHLTRIVAFGNCDAASALILFHGFAAIDALILTNPWTIETEGNAADHLPPAAAIRSRYREKLKYPRELLRLLTGGVNLRKLISGLAKASAKPASASTSLPARLARALAASETPTTILLAKSDNTAVAFAEHWNAAPFAPARARITPRERNTDSHSFARSHDKAWLADEVLKVLAAS